MRIDWEEARFVVSGRGAAGHAAIGLRECIGEASSAEEALGYLDEVRATMAEMECALEEWQRSQAEDEETLERIRRQEEETDGEA